MHEGYIFTLGICGSTRTGYPALVLLEAMLRALPPVKRAAHLGEVLWLEQDQHLHDPLLEPLLTDMRDAELLLIVTPLHTATLPFRLATLLDTAINLVVAGELQRTFAVLVGIGSDALPEPVPMALLQRFCDDAGIIVAGKTVLTEAQAAEQVVVDRVAELARQAYALARQDIPDALP
jgi:hypothetical protein